MKHVKIKPSSVNFDERYQRDRNASRITAIARGLDMARIGAPDVSMRSDGTYWAIDGMHRICALCEAGRGDEPILCVVHEGLTVREEAMLFLKLNGARVAVGVWNKYKASLEAKDKTTCDINRIVRSKGLQVDRSQAWKHICAIQAMQYVHGVNDNLSDTLDVLLQWEAHAVDQDLSALEGVLVRTMSDFLALYNGKINRKQLMKRLNCYKPDALIRAIRRSQAEAVGLHVPKWVSACEQLRQFYNVKSPSKLQTAAVAASGD